MADLEKAQAFFEHEQTIPYRIPLSVDETDNCCAGKHIRLKKNFEELGIPTRYRICWFRWSDTPIPSTLRTLPHEDDCTHLYLEILIDDHWLPVDATWDPGLAPLLPISLWSTPFNGTTVAVPSYKTLSPEDSEADMRAFNVEVVEQDLKKNGIFFKALNDWLVDVRNM